jgi:hypothetical protein
VRVKSNKDNDLIETSREMDHRFQESLHLELPERTITSKKSKEKKQNEDKEKRKNHYEDEDRLD